MNEETYLLRLYRAATPDLKRKIVEGVERVIVADARGGDVVVGPSNETEDDELPAAEVLAAYRDKAFQRFLRQARSKPEEWARYMRLSVAMKTVWARRRKGAA